MEEFEYKPLRENEIRILKLHPGHFDDDICVSLVHETLLEPPSLVTPGRLSLRELRKTLPEGWEAFETPEGRYFFDSDEVDCIQYTHPNANFRPELYAPALSHSDRGFKPEYEALSYVWGSNKSPVIVKIHEHDEEIGAFSDPLFRGTLQMRQHLASALRHLRYPDRFRTLWIDAICINQRDEAERSEQVARMGLIFSLAYRVIVWLGPQADASSHALSRLQYIGEQVEIANDNWRFCSANAEKADWYLPGATISYDEETWTAVAALLSRAYFERVWVMQEFRLANSKTMIRCGHDEISICHFRRSVEVLSWNENLAPKLEFLAQKADDLVYISSQALTDVLDSSRKRKCKDPRDKAYGILSLAPRDFARKITVDYTLSIAQVYSDFMLQHLNHTARFDLLPFCSASKQRTRVSSWVPDWSTIPKSLFPHSYRDQAASFSRAIFRHEPFKVLDVAGVVCATISNVSEPIQDYDSAIDILKAYEPEDLLTGRYVNGESLIDSWIRVILLNVDRERYPEHLSYPRIQDWRDASLEEISERSFKLQAIMLSHGIVDNIRTDCLLSTNEKYFGYGRSTARPGDLICVILGCYCPMILRPRNSHGFSVVGNCYIQGLMDGEALLGNIPSPWMVRQYYDGNFCTSRFFNKSKEFESDEDPRLGPLPPEWERVERERTPDDPIHFSPFRNKHTGEEINWDPRMEPEELEKRGVKLHTFRLGGDEEVGEDVENDERDGNDEGEHEDEDGDEDEDEDDEMDDDDEYEVDDDIREMAITMERLRVTMGMQ